MRELFQIVLNISLDDVLTTPNMHKLCLKLGHHPTNDEPYEDLFYRVFLNQIEPYLQTRPATIITHFPAQLAALAELDPNDHRYAERFELYLRHIELANAFTELCDPAEQKERFLGEQIKRKQLQKPVYPIDPSFLSAIEQIPGAAGIALGVDRLVMAALGCQDIDDVLVLPMSIQAST
jgi:lysyl-tRNA synthetase class 2